MILSRQYGYGYGNSCNYYGNCHSAWYRWGRWVLAGILIFLAIVLIFFFMCLRKRRSRRRMTSASTRMTYQAPIAPQTGAYYNQEQNQDYNPGYNQGYNQNYAAPEGPPPQYGGYEQCGNVEMPGNTYHPGRK